MERELDMDYVSQIPIEPSMPVRTKHKAVKEKKTEPAPRRGVSSRKASTRRTLAQSFIASPLAAIRFFVPCLPVSLLMVFFTALYLGLDTRFAILVNAFVFGMSFALGCSFFNWIWDNIFHHVHKHTGKLMSIFISFFVYLVGYVLILNYFFSLPMGYILEGQNLVVNTAGGFPAATVNLVIVMAIARWLFTILRPSLSMNVSSRGGRASI